MDIDTVIKTLLQNRGLTNAQQIDDFFPPPHPEKIPSPFNSLPAIKLINAHIKKNYSIAIYGDYDVDGICSTAILWETLYSNYKNVFPHIPHRESEGYGLSTKGVDHCLAQGAKLIIAVDNGITAIEQTNYCKQQGCDIIIIDHHEPGPTLPQPSVLLHSTMACAAGLTWMFCRDYLETPNLEHLSLVAIATICDIVPLLETNRSLVKFGLEQLNQTQRPGLLSLFAEARIKPGNIGTYEAGFVIGPRLNAMGRLEHAIDSLRLLCTPNPVRAAELAQLLTTTNRQRQVETDISVSLALGKFTLESLPSMLLSADTSYHPGVIGLVANKLVDSYRRPSLAISIADDISKGSGRSIAGFHLTDFLRQHENLFISLGGHAMACGFTIKTDRIDELAQVITQAQIDPQLFIKNQRVDLEMPLNLVGEQLWEKLRQFTPFGLGNPQPIFSTPNVTLSNCRPVGRTGQHLKCSVDGLSAIAFNQPTIPSTAVDITYSIEQDTWNGNSQLQLIIKDLKSAD